MEISYQKCSAVRPSPHDWRRRKDEIIQLYQDQGMHLGDVMTLMENKYDFVATKRMYDTRFRKWGVSKVMKSTEKEFAMREIARSRATGPIPISDKKMKKIIRYLQMQARKEQLPPGLYERRRSLNRLLLERHASQQTTAYKDSSESPIPASDKGDADVGFRNVGTQDQSILTPNSSLEDITSPNFDVSALKVPYLAACSTSESSTTEYTDSSTASPSGASVPTLMRTTADQTKELALYSIQQFHWYAMEQALDASPSFNILTLGSTPQSKSFWSNIKHGIYIWKLDSKTDQSFADIHYRGLTAFQEARQLADQAISSAPFDFCREMLSTLSPTNAHGPSIALSSVRQHILSYIKDIAAIWLKPGHPIALLSTALSQDDGSPEVSASGLELMRTLFQQFPDFFRTASHKLTETMVTFLRRAGRLEEARVLADDALLQAESDCGKHSTQARRAAAQLASVLTNLGDYGRTLKLRMDIVKQSTRQSDLTSESFATEDNYYRDDVAIYAMEDLAEYYVRFNNNDEGIVWLQRAETLAFDLWGDTVATSHISDKLTNLLCGNAEGQVADGKVVLVA